jgi:oligopeptide transport system permease protein
VLIVVLALFALLALAPRLAAHGVPGPDDPHACDLRSSVEAPSSRHWLGTDVQGCDVATRLVFATRASLGVATGAALATAVLALVAGGLAGWYGGRIDHVVGIVSGLVLAFPPLLGALLLLALFTGEDRRTVSDIVIVLTVLGWPVPARLYRAAVRHVRTQAYIDASRSVGCSDLAIHVRHVIPNAGGVLLVHVATDLAGYVGAEATLTFLGLGLPLGTVSWGRMINEAAPRIASQPHLLIGPAALLVTFTTTAALLGDLLGDTLHVSEPS